MEQKLARMQSVNIEKVKKDELKDIKKLNIEQGEPPIQLLIKFMCSMGNPYIFRVNDTPVKVVFSKSRNAVSLQNALVNIARSKRT